jgi:twitching motility protein PilT
MTGYKTQEVEIERLFSNVLEADASDLHLLVGKPPMIRVDSRLSPLSSYPVLDGEQIEKLVLVLLSDFHKEQLRANKQVDFSYDFRGHARFRVNVYYQKGTQAAAFRRIPSKIRTLQELGLPAKLADFTKHRQGLALFVGPSGHGKSTTLAALIDIINQTRTEHIITIEDPIEYLFVQNKSLISQREVYQDTAGFARAIRATLREDANVVMVGEMRDLESIATTVTVAETGHLVFATLHTNEAAQTIDRIIDVFPAHQQNQIRSQLASILLGVVSQRLLPRIGGGQIPAVEILINTNAMKNLIREGRIYEIPNIIQTSQNEGMVSLDRSLADLVRQGVVDLENAMAYANDLDLFKSLVRRF